MCAFARKTLFEFVDTAVEVDDSPLYAASLQSSNVHGVHFRDMCSLLCFMGDSVARLGQCLCSAHLYAPMLHMSVFSSQCRGLVS